MEKAELIISALQQRIGELTVNYETQIAVLRAEFTLLTKQQEDLEMAKKEYSDSIAEKIASV